MNDLFLKKNVPHCPNLRVEHIDESNYDSLLKSLRQIKAPLFVKVDDGMDSEGLFQDCVAQTPEMALVTAKKLIHEFGPVNIQSYLPGREFTVALTPKGPLHPVERIFQKDELFSPKNGTASEKPLGVEETQLIETCKEVAWKAYQAVEGSCYGRADLRCDSENRVFALEVNTTCGFGPNSYFAISCRAANSSREKVVADIILSELNAWNSRKINSQPQEILKRSNSMNVEAFRKTEMA
ncbi:hypothetical protein HMI56_001089 [Coelomomyces lativittatus]|nr:hypothetical protein HMI56_001089 [Coelomomyces lativittatus]